MPTPELGRDENVNVREIWAYEDRNFTPWLSKNLDQLGKVLNTKLELVQTEEPVGPYFLDILAKETDTGVLVAIENQLEETDLTHLGQLLTYATGCGAHVAIWVAPEFGYEHAQALHRLNEWTSESIRFYGVKIEVIKKGGDACPEPRFRKVVYPGGWDKELTLKQWEMPERTRRYHDFFQPLTAKLMGEGFAEKVIQYYGRGGRFFPSRLHPDIGYAVYLEGKEKNDASVTLHIRAEDNGLTKRIFDELKKQQKQIESCFETEAEWCWQRYDKEAFSCVNLRRDGSIDDPLEKLEATRTWMLDQLPKLKEVLDPHLERVLNELQSEGAGGAGT